MKLDRTRLTTAVGTFGVAIGIGFVMQHGGSIIDTFLEDRAKPQINVVQASAGISADTLGVLAASGTNNAQIPLSTSVVQNSAAAVASRRDCIVRLMATLAPAASADLTVTAPCHANERLTMHHEGLIFTGVTDNEGRFETTIPALNKHAVFIAAFESGAGAVVNTRMNDVDLYDRVVLQWKGDTPLQIHAREFGADYGAMGHVWADSAMNADRAELGQGGFLTRLGDARTAEPMMAEIYTFPSGSVQSSGVVRLTVETPVTPANCGREIEAETFQVRRGAAQDAVEVTLAVAVPPCDAVGDHLVLQNLLTDLTIAQN